MARKGVGYCLASFIVDFSNVVAFHICYVAKQNYDKIDDGLVSIITQENTGYVYICFTSLLPAYVHPMLKKGESRLPIPKTATHQAKPN
jgi:hypothetical protein